MEGDTLRGDISYGQRLVPTLIDERALAGHARPFASIPISNNVDDGFRDISYRVFANAINRCAHWLTESLGAPQALDTTLTYIGPHDFRYQILVVAAAKAGYVVRITASPCSKETVVDTVSLDVPPISAK